MLRNQVQGAVLGAAIGEALTEGAQMSEVVLMSLVKGATGPQEDFLWGIARDLLVWSKESQKGPEPPGEACLAGCADLDRGVHWRLAGGVSAGGCGSVIRAYPFALFFKLPQARHLAALHSLMTHRDPIALAACAAMAAGMALILQHEVHPRNVAKQMALAAKPYDLKTSNMIAEAASLAETETEIPKALSKWEGWAAHETIAATTYLFHKHSEDLDFKTIVSASKGGPGRLGALIGALAGAQCGLGKIEPDWVHSIKRSEILLDLADQVPLEF